MTNTSLLGSLGMGIDRAALKARRDAALVPDTFPVWQQTEVAP